METSAAASGTFTLGGELPIHRLGFGAMRITGPGIWGPPPDRDEALRTVRRVAELGIDFVDTAAGYGKHITDFFAARGIGWTVWVFHPIWTPSLLSDWSYAPSSPQGIFFRDLLRGG